MSERPVIAHRAAFAEALAAARASTASLAERSGRWVVPGNIEGVLDFMARSVAGGRVPTPAEREGLTLGPLAVRELHADPELSGRLCDLAHAFRRYPRLASAAAGRGVLQVEHGPGAFTKFRLELGHRYRAGYGDEVELQLPRADGLRPRHVELRWDATALRVRSLVEAPVKVDGMGRWVGELPSGGLLELGGSLLRFWAEADGFATLKPALSGPASDAHAILGPLREAGRLYGVFDAARDRGVLAALRTAVDEHASLYEGAEARALDEHAPYLVRFASDSALLERILYAGWGRAWGLFLASDEPVKMVRRSLRRLLMVDAEGATHRLYFRFYDPRAMRRFAPLATPRQRSEMLAASVSWLYEDEAGALQRFEEAAS